MVHPLDAVGGFAKLDHSEDMYTGLEMLGRGYRTQYVLVLVAKGISPESLPAFVNPPAARPGAATVPGRPMTVSALQISTREG